MDSILQNHVFELATEFRYKIERAIQTKKVNDHSFARFPYACCGDTSYLLAKYFMEMSIKTIYIMGEDSEQCSHAWLIIKDDGISKSVRKAERIPQELHGLYGMDWSEFEKDRYYYLYEDIKDGLIVDLTADQFDKEYPSVYVGYEDELHLRFSFINAQDYLGYLPKRLEKIYLAITSK